MGVSNCLGLAPKSSGSEAGSKQNFGGPASSVLLPLHPALALPQPGLLHWEVRLLSLSAKGKILLGQARYRGLQCLRQPLHLLLRAFQQMNVNSRSNITRRKQTSMGNWLDCLGFCFFFPSALHVCTVLWLNFWGYPAPHPSGETALMGLPVMRWMLCWCVFACALPTNWTVVVALPVT